MLLLGAGVGGGFTNLVMLVAVQRTFGKLGAVVMISELALLILFIVTMLLAAIALARAVHLEGIGRSPRADPDAKR